MGLIGGHKEFTDSTVDLEYLDKGLTLVGSRQPAWDFDDYANPTAFYTARGFAAVGTGAQAAANLAGGVYQLTSGASGGGQGNLNRGNALAGPPATRRFYFASRYRITTAVDSAAIVLVGVIASGGATITIGQVGATITKVNFQHSGTVAGTIVPMAPGFVQNSWYVAEVWSDGKGTVYGRVNGGPAVSGRLSGTYADLTPFLTARNGATAAARTLQVDWHLMVAER